MQWNFPETAAKLQLSEIEISKLAGVIELLYKSRVHYLDSLFGSIIAEVRNAGLLDQSLIVFTADHGEILYREHSPFKWVHGNVLLPDVLNVPLIIHAPMLKNESRRWDNVTRSIDVFPTMAGLSGIPSPVAHGVEGIDVTPALIGRGEVPDLLAHSHTTVPMTARWLRKKRKDWTMLQYLFPMEEEVGVVWTSIRHEDEFFRWRHIGDGRWDFETFDLVRDPTARQNLFDEDNPKHRNMAERLVEYKALLVENFGNDGQQRPSRTEEEQRLRALGYIQ